jgi:iron complex outermembrane receptor protein
VKTKDFFNNDFSGNGNVVAVDAADADQIGEELQVSGTAADGRLSYLAGVYLFDGEEARRTSRGRRSSRRCCRSPCRSRRARSEAETDSTSVFAQFDYRFTDALKATVGVRYTEDRKKFDFSLRR